MYTSIITAIVLTIILITLAIMFINVVTMEHGYIICKIANISINCNSTKCYIASSRPAVIHVFLIKDSDNMRQVICYTSCQVSRAPLIIAITPYDIAWRGDLSIVSKAIYLSPCGVTNYVPNCYPWIRLPDAKTSMLTKLPICNCRYRTIISGGVLGLCRS